MQRSSRRHSAVEYLSSFIQSRRHSASDTLVRVLHRRRCSAIEMLSSSTHQVMVAVSSVSIEEAKNTSSPRKSSMRRPTAKYTKMGERLRHVIPGQMQCSMACGGRACKYENPSRWSEEEQALKGLYSSWHGIKTVINLQRPGEHARCGNPLETESGFTYLPEVFMEAGIYFYNFGWKDYGVASLTTILDMVKVIAFALQEGKVAIHCHAGLGRTGVLTACYLVYATRMSADQAILFVRAKRANAIQTRGQLMCIREFSQFLIPLRNVFSCCEPRAHAVTVSQYLIRQRHLLHGYEARQLKHVPKIIHLACKLLLDFAENKQLIEEDSVEIPDLSAEIEKTVSQMAIIQLDKKLDSHGFDMGDHFEHTMVSATELIPSDSVLVSEQEFDPLFKWHNADVLQPMSQLRKRLSYSESDLQRAELFAEQSEASFTAPAQNTFSGHQQSLPQLNLRQPSPEWMDTNQISSSVLKVPELCLIKQSPSITVKSSPWEYQNASDQKLESPLFLRRKLPKEIHGTFSLRSSTTAAALKYLISETSASSHGTNKINEEECPKVNTSSKQKAGATKENISLSPLCEKAIDKTSQNDKNIFLIEDEERKSISSKEGIPRITLLSEMSIEEKRLAAGKALAFCMDFDEDLVDKVETWQHELNVREGTWERICMEKNPYVLCSLMWSWLEQLKEPVISRADIEALAHNYMDPNKAFYSLEKNQYQTLLCILDCMAQLRDLPFDVEDAILTRAIRAFTKVSFDADEGPEVYNMLKTILKSILQEKQAKLADCKITNDCEQNIGLQIS
ncbi:protein tyrosine phosphatase domain-containing protein 1 isoform X2 [Hypanus sabinus]|uniref:protein tyrosine phosphatase domain-containing protein 1 isoform X2 n=1 Tax=Hypanus sabinus TaxID=79690 RepID=UPI0028C3C92C|nr:protein tyrosine phosphatase domain-containing protein 1 isoform X2 [Hypanus sabinus]